MTTLFRHKPLLLGLALILVTNVVVIAGAMGNRSGEPDAILTLTERELSLRNRMHKENSGLSLRLRVYRNYYRGYYRDNNWLTGDKLKELGYQIVESDEHNVNNKFVRKSLPKEVYVVLEFNGDAYLDAVKKAEEKRREQENLLSGQPDSEDQQKELEAAERNLSQLKFSSTRLFTIDAGLDPEVLRQQYSDKSRYIIASAMIKLSSYYDREEKKSQIYGYISKVNITNIHVPLEQRTLFDNLPKQEYGENKTRLPRYQVKLAYGQRYEPWIMSVEEL